MMPFILSPEHSAAINQLLHDEQIHQADIPKMIRANAYGLDWMEDELLDYSALLEALIEMPLFSQPLLLESEEERVKSIKFHQNWLVLKDFHAKVNRDLDSIDELMTSSAEYDLYHIIEQGEYVFRVLGERFLWIDYRQYGFSDAYEMAYVLGAYLCNLMSSEDGREVEVRFGDVVYVYENHIHGDFRLTKYDISKSTMRNPLDTNTMLPVGKRKCIGAISAYHSIETTVLGVLIGFAHFERLKCDAIDRFEEVMQPILSGGQRFGAYADAGLYDSFTVMSGFIGFDLKQLPRLHRESGHDTAYQPMVENGELVVYLRSLNDGSGSVSMTIPPEHLSGLIVGLFDKVSRGNGRSSVRALEDTMKFYLTKYSVQAAPVEFHNKDVGFLIDMG